MRKPASLNRYGALICPRCDCDFLHHEDASIFVRKEDDYWTTVITQDTANVTSTKFPNSETCNPSPRRQGMIIRFSCESCGDAPLQLALYQHKGVTVLEWMGE